LSTFKPSAKGATFALSEHPVGATETMTSEPMPSPGSTAIFQVFAMVQL
jgi:hypothetical protein